MSAANVHPANAVSMGGQPAEKIRTLGDYLRVLKRRWVYFAVLVPACLFLAVMYAYLSPPAYRSAGTLMLEPSSLPQTLVPSLVGRLRDTDVDASQQLELLRRRVVSKEALLEVVQRVDPYPGDAAGADAKAARIAADTFVESVDPLTYKSKEYTTAFSVYYDNRDPLLAKRVADELLQLFVTYNQRVRAEAARDTYAFLTAQARQIEESMGDMEKRLSAFKTKHGEALPEAQGRNMLGLDRAQRDLDGVLQQLNAVEEREDLLRVQIEALSPSLTAAVADWRMELARLRGELALAEQKYTPEHPDVRRLRRAIAEIVAQGNAVDKQQTGVPDNPEYLRVRSQIDSVRRELATLRGRAGRLRAEIASYERAMTTAPTVERDYVVLAREYDNAQRRYQDVQEKIKAASLTQQLESEARGERFMLIREATRPSAPHSPNRLGVILLGLVLGLGLAVILAVMADASDPTVRSADDLEAGFGAMPIGAIPPIANAADDRRRKLAWGSAAAAYAVGIALMAIVVVSA